jgi:hypothetical protein
MAEKKEADPMTLDDLYQAAAEAVTGQRVKVRWQRPNVCGYWGMAQLSPDGTYFIDIDPSLPGSIKFRVFCHEIGHITADHIAASNEYKNIPVEYGGRIEAKQERDQALESEADAIGKRLETLATDYARRFGSDNPTAARLKALIYLSGLN